MPWSDSPDYEPPPPRFTWRGALLVVGVLLVFGTVYALIPGPHRPPVGFSVQAR